MQTDNIIKLAVFTAIGVLVFASLLMPVVYDAVETDDTFTNAGKWRMSENENGQVYTYNNTTREWSLNGVVVNSEYASTFNVILLDDLCIRSNGWIRGAQLTGNSVTTVVTNADDQTVISGNGLSGNGTYTQQGYGSDPNGDFLLTDYNKPVYMNGGSKIYATGTTAISNLFNAVFHIEGSINDGVTINANIVFRENYTLSDVVIDDVVIHYTPVAGYIDLYKLEGITFNFSCVATPTGEGDVVTISDFEVSYSSYVVPYEITAEKAIHADEPTRNIITIMPILLMAGLLLGIVAYAVRARLS